MTTDHLCPVCGFTLDEAPWRGGESSLEICPSCGIQFGYDDEAGGSETHRAEIYREWRARWVRSGMRWWSMGKSRMPQNWDPESQLRRLPQ